MKLNSNVSRAEAQGELCKSSPSLWEYVNGTSLHFVHIPAGTCPPPVAMKQTFENACLFLGNRDREREREREITFLKFNPNRVIEIFCIGFPLLDPPPPLISFPDEIFYWSWSVNKNTIIRGCWLCKKEKKRKKERINEMINESSCNAIIADKQRNILSTCRK